ncbi:YrdB family protein [Sinomonas sp. P47F7]|uniref:YrdB family protein n=1 Tax=Sinomonas sp. P47F7 TaxID=3410987 RepID=UPI003BF4F6C8
MPSGRWAAANATVAFLLEVSMLAALAYAGFHVAPPLAVVAGVGFPLLAMVLWGLFFAPRAGRRIPWPWLPLASLGMFAAAALALAAAGELLLAEVMGAVALANMVVSFWLRRKD